MKLNDQEKPYSLSVMEQYCKENIDIYNVEPIIREAFYEGLISADIAYIHLRVAQMEDSAEKITGRQIANEVGVSPSVIVKYKKNHKLGMTEKKHIQLLLKTHFKDLLDLWEVSNFNQALAEYVNKYKGMIIANGDSSDLQKRYYELPLEKEISKDVCRKIYREFVDDRIKPKVIVNEDVDCIISVRFIEGRENAKAEIRWTTVGEDRKMEFECSKERLVHGMVFKMQNVIGGLLSDKKSQRKVYLQRSNNRKVRLAMEYISLVNDKVYLL